MSETATPGRGTTNGNVRGNAEDRRRRREYLVVTYRADADVPSFTDTDWNRRIGVPLGVRRSRVPVLPVRHPALGGDRDRRPDHPRRARGDLPAQQHSARVRIVQLDHRRHGEEETMIIYRVTAGAGGSRRTIGEFETKADLEHALPRLERVCTPFV